MTTEPTRWRLFRAGPDNLTVLLRFRYIMLVRRYR